MTTEELVAIEARANAATERPWFVDGAFGPRLMLVRQTAWPVGEREDATAFIAAARTDVPALVAEVRRLRSLVLEASNIADVSDSSAEACARIRGLLVD